MNILVFLKQVADTEAKVTIGSDGKSLDIENKYAINFFDEFAVEEAIRMKEKSGDCNVTVCTYGPARAIEALRTAIAMGADRAFLIDGNQGENDDPLFVSRILAAFARKEGFDCILCGRQAIDDENANIGAMVAEFTGVPHVSWVTKIDATDTGKIRVECEIEGGRKTLDVLLPALFTAQKGLNEPRVPLITGVMKAMKTEIPVIDARTLDLPEDFFTGKASGVAVLSYELPKKRPPVKMIEGLTPEEKVGALISSLKVDAKVL